jgi:hypothetical protein
MEWINDLSSYLSQKHTPVGAKHIILHNLTQWLEPSNTIELPIDLTFEDLTKATQQQQRIGWRHFIRGRLSIEWGKFINLHLIQEKLYDISAEKWASDLLSINWKHILKIWRERCLEVHGSTPEEMEKHTKKQIFGRN